MNLAREVVLGGNLLMQAVPSGDEHALETTAARIDRNTRELQDAIMLIRMHACRAAVEEGILAGGGVAVVRAAKVLDGLSKKLKGDQKTGVDILRRALNAPLRQIAENVTGFFSILAEWAQAELAQTANNTGKPGETNDGEVRHDR